MPASFLPQGQRDDIDVLGPNLVVAVKRVSASTLPSGIFFELLMPRAGFTIALRDAFVGPIAEGIEGVSNRPDVAAVVFQEDVDEAGLIKFQMAITVQVAPTAPGQFGPFEATVTAPLEAFSDRSGIGSIVIPRIEEAVLQLQAAAAA